MGNREQTNLTCSQDKFTKHQDNRYTVQMGLLALGTPLTWEEASKYADHVREHGITQLLNIWNRYKFRSDDKLYWGDEVRLPRILIFNGAPTVADAEADRIYGCGIRRER
jgi:hypothetical protein